MTMARRAILAGIGVLAAGAALAHPHDALKLEQQGDIERQIMVFRASLKDAIAAKDLVKLKSMYAETYTHTHGSGKIDNRDARLISLMSGEPVVEVAQANELSFRLHGPDMVVLTGKSPILNVKEGRDYDFRWVQVYTRASGEWQLAVSQATRLPVTS